MSKGSGGTRAKNSSTAHGGAKSGGGGATTIESLVSKAHALDAALQAAKAKANTATGDRFWDLHTKRVRAEQKYEKYLRTLQEKYPKAYEKYWDDVEASF